MRKYRVKILIILVILLFITLIMYFTKNKEEINNNVTEISGDVNISTNVNMQTNTTKNVAILGMRNLIIKANTKNVNFNFQNPIENKGAYYQTFELRLLNNSKEGYEVLYKSDMVKPGDEITEISLSREIEKGEYDAILYVQPYRMDAEKTPTNDAKIKIKIIAK